VSVDFEGRFFTRIRVAVRSVGPSCRSSAARLASSCKCIGRGRDEDTQGGVFLKYGLHLVCALHRGTPSHAVRWITSALGGSRLIEQRRRRKQSRIVNTCLVFDAPHSTAIPPQGIRAESDFTGFQSLAEDLIQPMPVMVLSVISYVQESIHLAYHGGEESLQ